MISLAPDLWLFTGYTETNDRDRATRRLVSEILECDLEQVRIESSPSGKPFVTHPARGLFFNRAHRPGWWVLAVARDRQIGVDLEPLPSDQDWPLVAKHLLSPGEQSWLNNLPAALRNEAFGRLWTGKEAVLKAQDVGISEGITDPDFKDTLGYGPWTERVRHQVATKTGNYEVEWIRYSPDRGRQLLISRSQPS